MAHYFCGKNNGHSLVELLCVIAIFGILSYSSYISFYLIQLHKIHSTKNEIVNFLNIAKTQAILSKKQVIVCGFPLNQIDVCAKDLILRLVMTDKNKSHIISFIDYRSFNQVSFKGFQEEIVFLKEGITNSNGRFYQCYKDKLAYQVIISRQLRIRIASQKENDKDNNKYCG